MAFAKSTGNSTQLNEVDMCRERIRALASAADTDDQPLRDQRGQLDSAEQRLSGLVAEIRLAEELAAQLEVASQGPDLSALEDAQQQIATLSQRRRVLERFVVRERLKVQELEADLQRRFAQHAEPVLAEAIALIDARYAALVEADTLMVALHGVLQAGAARDTRITAGFGVGAETRYRWWRGHVEQYGVAAAGRT